jgi:hypothetical protein
MPPCSWSEAAIYLICRSGSIWRELTADQIAVLLATPPFTRIVLRRLSASPPTGQEAAGRS